MAAKLSTLKAVAHNLADSVGSGIGMLVGVYEMDIYGEAAASPEGYIEVDFLAGTTSGATPSPSLVKALQLYAREGLPRLCESHGVSPSDFGELKVRFRPGLLSGRFVILVADQKGRCATAEYGGSPARRIKVLDDRGRMRPK